MLNRIILIAQPLRSSTRNCLSVPPVRVGIIERFHHASNYIVKIRFFLEDFHFEL